MKTFQTLMAATAVISCMSFAAPAFADTVVYNSTPTDTWNNYGTGNDYNPANTAVLTTGGSNQLYLRAHKTFDTAPASVGNVYSFALGTQPISFDWGVDLSSYNGVTALLTLTNLAGGSVSYNPLLTPDNSGALNGSTQNSGRLEWFIPLSFNSNVDSTFDIKLDVTDATGMHSLNVVAQLGNGFQGGAVPEPATWAMMLMGFGGLGAVIRRRRATAAFA